ncbi:hypothetical protein ROBYS_38350 [Roseobacter sp. OBYS 0001]|nr:hypothetical protein ROBYS_38350 [Roseobacter sp. OBYS 0001]
MAIVIVVIAVIEHVSDPDAAKCLVDELPDLVRPVPQNQHELGYTTAEAIADHPL